MEDNKLVNLALGGSYQARETLLQRYYDEIYTYIYKSIANQSAAYEFTHELLMQLSNNLGKYKSGKKGFIIWLYRAATDLIMDYYESDIHKEITSNFLEEQEGENEELLEDAMLRSDYETKVLEALMDLDKLNSYQKKVIILSYYTKLDKLVVSLVLKQAPKKTEKLKSETVFLLENLLNSNIKIMEEMIL